MELRWWWLRYVAMQTMREAGGELTIPELVSRIEAQGFTIPGRPSKTLSDGFRGDLWRGRVIRVARGRYRIGPMPGGTQRRIAAEVRRLRMTVRAH